MCVCALRERVLPYENAREISRSFEYFVCDDGAVPAAAVFSAVGDCVLCKMVSRNTEISIREGKKHQ